MKLSTKVLLLVGVAPLLIHCAVEVRTPRVYVPPPPPPPEVQVDVGAQPAPPPPQGDATAAPTDYDDGDPSALTDFHAALDPHGQWIEDSRYGTVWVPNPAEVGPDFVPYTTGGHWTYGDDYVWTSDYDWGWAPFHYGRWVQGDQGWSWIPGRTYAPAWVTWSTGDPGYGYVGWAPAPPEFYWRGGVYNRVDWVVEPRWGYVGTGNLFEARLGGRVVRGNAAASITVHMHPYAAAGAGGGGGAFHGHAAGPAPTAIGVNPGKIVHPSPNDPGLARATGFSHPSTAAALGGQPPVHVDHTLKGGAVGTAAAGATNTGHLAPQALHGEPAVRTTGTTTTTATTPSTLGRSNVQVHEQGVAATHVQPVPQTRPTATAPASTPPAKGGSGKKR